MKRKIFFVIILFIFLVWASIWLFYYIKNYISEEDKEIINKIELLNVEIKDKIYYKNNTILATWSIINSLSWNSVVSYCNDKNKDCILTLTLKWLNKEIENLENLKQILLDENDFNNYVYKKSLDERISYLKSQQYLLSNTKNSDYLLLESCITKKIDEINFTKLVFEKLYPNTLKLDLWEKFDSDINKLYLCDLEWIENFKSVKIWSTIYIYDDNKKLNFPKKTNIIWNNSQISQKLIAKDWLELSLSISPKWDKYCYSQKTSTWFSLNVNSKIVKNIDNLNYSFCNFSKSWWYWFYLNTTNTDTYNEENLVLDENNLIKLNNVLDSPWLIKYDWYNNPVIFDKVIINGKEIVFFDNTNNTLYLNNWEEFLLNWKVETVYFWNDDLNKIIKFFYINDKKEIYLWNFNYK